MSVPEVDAEGVDGELDSTEDSCLTSVIRPDQDGEWPYLGFVSRTEPAKVLQRNPSEEHSLVFHTWTHPPSQEQTCRVPCWFARVAAQAHQAGGPGGRTRSTQPEATVALGMLGRYRCGQRVRRGAGV